MNRLFAILLIALCVAPATAQTRVFLEWQINSDIEYTQQQIDVVDWVADRQSADISILATGEYLPSGAERLTTFFYGAVSDTLETVLPSTHTAGDIREALLQLVKGGLAPYLVKNAIPITILTKKPSVQTGAPQRTQPTEDPWKSWVFSVGGTMNANGQASSDRFSRSFNGSANRTTEGGVVSVSGRYSKNESNFNLPTGDVITSTLKTASVNGLFVLSTGENSGIGVKSQWEQSSYNNTENAFEVQLVGEYNLVPYTESRSKSIRFSYAVQLRNYNYIDETIFNELNENVVSHILSSSTNFNKPWGSVRIRLSATHHLTNFNRSLTDSYNLTGFINTNLRLYKGLSLRLNINASRLRDQFYLPLSTATEEEILLGTINLPTGWSYYFNTGLTYRFGSIFNSAVNSRLGF